MYKKILIVLMIGCFLLGMATKAEAENVEEAEANVENKDIIPLENWKRNRKVDEEVFEIADKLEEICLQYKDNPGAIGWSPVAVRLVGRLKKLGKSALPAIYDVAKDTSRNVKLRKIMMSELGFSKNLAVTEPLISFLLDKSENPSLRYNAADLLGRIIKDTTATPALIETMKDKSNPEKIRSQAASAFVSIHDKRAFPHLLELMADDSSKDVRAMAAWSVGSNAFFFKNTSVTIPLIKGLNREKSDVVRIKIIGALSVTNDRRAVTSLVNLIKSRGPNYRYAIKYITNLKYPESIEILKELLQDENEGIRFDAAKALLKTGNKSVIPEVEKVLPTLEVYHRNMISDSLRRFKAEK